MVKIAATVILAGAFSVTSVFAQVTSPPTDTTRQQQVAREYLISGYALVAGGFLFQVLAQTALAQTTVVCTDGRFSTTCTEFKDPNMGATFGGLGMVTVGAVYVILGRHMSKKARAVTPTSFLVTPTGWRVEKRLSFSR